MVGHDCIALAVQRHLKLLMKKSLSNQFPEITPKSNRGKQSSIRVERADEIEKPSLRLDSHCSELSPLGFSLWATENGRARGLASQGLHYLRWESSAVPDAKNRVRNNLLKAPVTALHGQSFCVTSTGLLAFSSEYCQKDRDSNVLIVIRSDKLSKRNRGGGELRAKEL